MQPEKLLVEFEVERTLQDKWGFGYEEKYLMFRGEKAPYKAIVRRGQLLAIVKRGYKLVPNELVKQIVEGIVTLEIAREENWGGRMYLLCRSREKKDIGCLVINSVDGTHTLRVDVLLRIDGLDVPLVSVGRTAKRLEVIKRYHKKNLVVEDLRAVIDNVLEEAARFRDLILRVFEVEANKHTDIFEWLATQMPKKYLSQLLTALQVNGLAPLSVGEAYRIVAQKIWSAKIDMRTKLLWFSKLNEAIWIIAEAEGI